MPEIRMITSKNFKKANRLIGLQLQEMNFKTGKTASVSLPIKSNDQLVVYLKATVPDKATAGEVLRLDIVQRDDRSKNITGGIALLINVK